MLVALSQVFKQFAKDGTVMRNIVEDVDRVPGKPKRFATHTPAQVEQVLRTIRGDRNRHAWHLALYGLRRGEIGGLRWTKAVAAAGVPHIRLHDARHTCGTTMHLQGVPPAVIAAWLGHADVSFTMRTYVHSQPDALAEGAHSLARIVTIFPAANGVSACFRW